VSALHKFGAVSMTSGAEQCCFASSSSCSGGRKVRQTAEQGLITRHNLLHSKTCLQILKRRRGTRSSQRPSERIRKGGHARIASQPTIIRPCHDLFYTSRTRSGNYRCAAGESLKHHIWESLNPGTQNKVIRGCKPFIRVGLKSREMYLFMYAQARCQRNQLVVQRACTNDYQI